MPIYEYKCPSCGAAEDVFTRSFADAADCIPCGKCPEGESFARRVVANKPGMCLVGTGFYNTDFRDTRPNNPETI